MTNKSASAGNRTRVTSMATMYSTTRPLMPDKNTAACSHVNQLVSGICHHGDNVLWYFGEVHGFKMCLSPSVCTRTEPSDPGNFRVRSKGHRIRLFEIVHMHNSSNPHSTRLNQFNIFVTPRPTIMQQPCPTSHTFFFAFIIFKKSTSRNLQQWCPSSQTLCPGFISFKKSTSRKFVINF